MSVSSYLVGQNLESRYEITKELYTGEVSSLYEGKILKTEQPVWIVLLNQLFMYEEKTISTWLEEIELSKQVQSPFWKKPIDVCNNREKRVFAIFEAEPNSAPLSTVGSELSKDEIIELFFNLALLVDQVSEIRSSSNELAFSVLNLHPSNIWIQSNPFRFVWLRLPDTKLRKVGNKPESRVKEELSYLSAEEIKGFEHTRESSYFTIGTMLAEVVSGQKMFANEDSMENLAQIMEGKPPELQKANISPEMKYLIERLLEVDPKKRLTNPSMLKKKLEKVSESSEQLQSVSPIKWDIESSAPSTPSIASFSKADWSSADLNPPPAPSDQTIRLPSPSESDFFSMEQLQSMVKYAETERDKVQKSFDLLEKVIASKEILEKKTEELQKKAGAQPEEKKGWFGVPVPKEIEASEKLTRKAVVQYYKQMSPQALFPLSIELIESADFLKVIESLHVADMDPQTKSHSPLVRIVPIIPGCLISPPELTINLKVKQVKADFWVVPLVEGNLASSKLQIWHEGQKRDEIAIPCQSKSQLHTKSFAFLSILLGFGNIFVNMFQSSGTKETAHSSNISPLLQSLISFIGNHGLRLAIFFFLLAGISFFLFSPKKAEDKDASLSILLD